MYLQGKEREVMNMKLSTTVRTKGGQYVWVDTCFTYDHGFETMIFPCDEQGNVTDWGDLDMNLYSDAESAKRGHELTCKVWADVTVNDNYEIIEAVI